MVAKTGAQVELVEETPYRWRIDRHGEMRVPGVIFTTRELLPDPGEDQALAQVAAVATLPGIVEASYAMPDMHWGYGFPIGGVAATDVEQGGVISPGGVGFDISCGVRLLLADLHIDELRPRLTALMDALDVGIPRGMGKGAVWRLSRTGELEKLLAGGARYAVEQGHGVPEDLDRCEDRGVLADADPDAVGPRARERGLEQVGSLGSGNHFLEVEAVDEIYDERLAEAFGLWPGRVCVMIHTGSRGLGHQICTDFVRRMGAVMTRYGITVPDPQLACAPVKSPEGRAYLGAMAAAANYARANRQLLGQATRRAFGSAVGSSDLTLLYDVSHNLAKLETHRGRLLCVHRKGATLALPPGHEQLPADLRPFGQPVLVPGSMGTGSHVMAGVPGAPAFASACHGAGRRLSRQRAVKTTTAARLRAELQAAGVAVRGASARGLTEETPEAYKDVDLVVDACHKAGLARKVAKLAPVGVVKG